MSRPEDMLAAYLDLLLAEPAPVHVEDAWHGVPLQIPAVEAPPAPPVLDEPVAPQAQPDGTGCPDEGEVEGVAAGCTAEVCATAAGCADVPAMTAAEDMAETIATAATGATARYRLCRVARLAVALPEHLVAAVLPLGELHPVKGAASWVLGQATTALGVRTVADLSQLLGREHCGQGGALVVLADCPWMLCVDDAGEVLDLPAEAIRWRSHEQRVQGRRWLAGMASQPACALIDRGGLCALLDEREALR